MKNTALLTTLLLASSMAYAGGDIEMPQEVETTTDTEVAISETTPYYIGLGLSSISVRDQDVSLNITSETGRQDRLGNLSLFAGYNFNKNFALEGRYTQTIATEDRVEINSIALFVKAQYEVIDDTNLYAMIGYGKTQIDGVKHYDIDISENGLQWGLGVSYAIDKSFGIFADYTSVLKDADGVLYRENGVDADAFTLGFTYTF